MSEPSCVCPLAGWCARHHVVKTPFFHRACQKGGEFFREWELGRGPGQDGHVITIGSASPPAASRDAGSPPPPRDVDHAPCQHLGGHERTAHCKPCQSGNRTGLVEVYFCDVHSECTLHSTLARGRDGKRFAACSTCQDYIAKDASS